MSRLYGIQLPKGINESFYCKPEIWLTTEFDGNFLDYWKLFNESYLVKMKNHNGLDDNCDEKILPAHLGAFVLSNIKRSLNNFLKEINEMYNINVYNTDTHSLYTERKTWNVLDEAWVVGENFC